MLAKEAQRVYPIAFRLAKQCRPCYRTHLKVLKTAVGELDKINPKRTAHIHMVVRSLEAITQRDYSFFENALKTPLETEEYKQRYQNGLRMISEVYTDLSPEVKKYLTLAVWAHDLGTSFGIEWHHHIFGTEIARQLIGDEAVASLVYYHGYFSNLPSSSLPQDIHQLEINLHPALFILDFCDAASRRDQEGKYYNPIGLNLLEYYINLSNPDNLAKLEEPNNLFDLRFRYGFGPVIFNSSLDEDDQIAMFSQASGEIKPEELIDFYGRYFRANFLNVVLESCETPEERGFILVSIYQVYRKAGMSGEVLLWPDNDLGWLISKDLSAFVQRCKSFIQRKGINSLLEANPSEGQIKFLASKLYR